MTDSTLQRRHNAYSVFCTIKDVPSEMKKRNECKIEITQVAVAGNEDKEACLSEVIG